MSILRFTGSSILAAALAFTLTTARDAHACGGLFCSAAAPVNQAAERIVFAQDGEGTTSAIIEIQYQGPSERFAWVLPVPGVPEVGLSSKQALNLLQNATQPEYWVNTEYGDSCEFDEYDDFGYADAGAAGDGDGDGDGDGPEFVHVLASGSVGPYDFNVIKIDPEAPAPVSLMIDWLAMNNYDVSSLGRDLLGEYVAEGMNFLAVRLSKSASTGSVRPIRITYQSERPMIPIRPTAVAANPDMGVLTWVLGKHRAIPANYYALELNDALIDWFDWRSNYDDVVIAAANEAGGHGFVTEYAGDSRIARGLAWWSAAEAARRDLDDYDNVQVLLSEAARQFGALDGFPDVVRETVPLREGVDAEEFTSCAECYFYSRDFIPADGGIDTDPSDPVFGTDRAKFLAALDRLVVDPMRETQKLFDAHDTMTRLYTTLSPDEMTVDPEFDFNPDAEGVSNYHEVTRVLECTADGTVWTLELPSGIIVSGSGYRWPIGLDDDLPFNLRVLQYSTSGPPEVITDNLNPIEARIADLPLPTPLMRGDRGSTGPGGEGADAGVNARSDATSTEATCGCRVAGRAAPAGAGTLWALGLAGLFAWRRRTPNGSRRRSPS